MHKKLKVKTSGSFRGHSSGFFRTLLNQSTELWYNLKNHHEERILPNDVHAEYKSNLICAYFRNKD